VRSLEGVIGYKTMGWIHGKVRWDVIDMNVCIIVTNYRRCCSDDDESFYVCFVYFCWCSFFFMDYGFLSVFEVSSTLWDYVECVQYNARFGSQLDLWT
jgi:hypothetical protein